MSKIDDFFHKNLSNYEEADDQWNIPDDHVWNQAQLEFPQEKKKRRGFFWIWGGASLLALGIIAFTLFTNINSTINNTDYTDKNPLSANQQIEPNALENSASQSQNISNTSDSHIGETKDDYATNDHEIRTEHNNTTIKSSDKIDNSIKDQLEASTRIQAQKEVKIVAINALDDASFKESIIEVKPEQINNSKGLVSNLKQTSNEENLMTPSAIPSNMEFVNQSDLGLLGLNNINPLDRDLQDYVLDHLIIEQPEIQLPKIEVGISRNFYFLGLINGVNLGDDPRDEVFLNTDIQNINLNLRGWIAPKWSIQSGIYVSSLDGALDFSVFFPATAEDLEILTNTEYQEVADQNNRNEDPSLMITLLNPPSIDVGDEIFFEGNVGLELRAIQIPLMVHRHWKKKRFEYLLGGGLTFEYVTSKQNGSNFNLAVNGTPVESIITQPPIASGYYDASIYFETGTKYHFANNINLGATLRLSVTEPVFSGIDLGLYYRW